MNKKGDNFATECGKARSPGERRADRAENFDDQQIDIHIRDLRRRFG
jgi:hypothetical protein